MKQVKFTPELKLVTAIKFRCKHELAATRCLEFQAKIIVTNNGLAYHTLPSEKGPNESIETNQAKQVRFLYSEHSVNSFYAEN